MSFKFNRSRASLRGTPRAQRPFAANNSFNKPAFGGSFQRGSRRRPTSTLTSKDPSIFIKKAIAVIEEIPYTPHNSFKDFPINDLLKHNIVAKGYEHPTPIQDQAIMPILEGKDLIGLANTGTGKTAAFLIPLINKLNQNRHQKVLIIAPTRELAVQINQEFREFSRGMGLYSAILIGGSGMHRQVADIRKGAHVVVATPGRLKDMIQREVIDLQKFNYFVLDEVDLMVDIGFIHDIKYFISLLPEVRQALFFSATIDDKVQSILQSFVHNPITVSVRTQPTSDNVDQDIVKVKSREEKIDQLHDLLISDGFSKVLIFGRTKHAVEKLNKQLVNRGFKVGAIHGNKNQNQRQRALENFKRNETQILLATDVASRGLDIDNVTHVINYDLPDTFEDYIHRIGRTGRAGQKGQALTFVE